MFRSLEEGGRRLAQPPRGVSRPRVGVDPFEPPMPARLVTVVGVSRNVAGFRFSDLKSAGIFLPTSVNAPRTSIVVRMRGEAELARRTLLDRLSDACDQIVEGFAVQHRWTPGAIATRPRCIRV